jgi:hypothetical protein
VNRFLTLAVLTMCLMGCKRDGIDANSYTVIESHVGSDGGAGSATPATYVIQHGKIILHAECNVLIPRGDGVSRGPLAACPVHPKVPIGEPLMMTLSESGDSLRWIPQGSDGVVFRVISEKEK